MALMKSDQIPEDAVVMDEMEASTYAWDIVSNWQNSSEAWALRYTPAMLGSFSGLSGMLINKHYRFKLKLGTYGYLSSIIPISIMPGLMSALFHRYLISTEMLLMGNEFCPVCYEIKSAALQLTFGIAYPMVLGPISGLMFAHRYNTYRIPSLVEGPKVLYQFLKKMTKPFSGTLVALTAVHVGLSSVLTYFEMRNNIVIRNRLIEIENKLLSEKEIKK